MMRVLITGASGFIGRYVLNELRRLKIDTVIVGRNPPPPPGEGWGEGIVSMPSVKDPLTLTLSRRERELSSSHAEQFIEADLLATTDFSKLMLAAQATHLLHLAWYAEHGKFWASPLNLRWVDATLRLVEAFCDAGGKRVVVAGSCAEYDWAQSYCNEIDTPLLPASLYGAAKDATRRLVMALCSQRHVSCAWGRVFLLYGAGENRERLIPLLIDVFRGTRPPFAINAAAFRDFLHAADVARAFVTLLQANTNGAYNISSGDALQVEEIVRTLAAAMNADPQILLNLSADRPGEPHTLVGENQKLRALGWAPFVTLAQGLERTVHEITS